MISYTGKQVCVMPAGVNLTNNATFVMTLWSSNGDLDFATHVMILATKLVGSATSKYPRATSGGGQVFAIRAMRRCQDKRKSASYVKIS
jgi:hypothetical protein